MEVFTLDQMMNIPLTISINWYLKDSPFDISSTLPPPPLSGSQILKTLISIFCKGLKQELFKKKYSSIPSLLATGILDHISVVLLLNFKKCSEHPILPVIKLEKLAGRICILP